MNSVHSLIIDRERTYREIRDHRAVSTFCSTTTNPDMATPISTLFLTSNVKLFSSPLNHSERASSLAYTKSRNNLDLDQIDWLLITGHKRVCISN